jgi:hypothetical protein
VVLAVERRFGRVRRRFGALEGHVDVGDVMLEDEQRHEECDEHAHLQLRTPLGAERDGRERQGGRDRPAAHGLDAQREAVPDLAGWPMASSAPAAMSTTPPRSGMNA